MIAVELKIAIELKIVFELRIENWMILVEYLNVSFNFVIN